MSAATELHFGPFSLRGRNGPLLHDGVEIKLQPRTMALLWTLVSQPGEVITKSALLDAIWPRQVVGEDALAFQVKTLRRALQDDPKTPRYVLTAHRVGLRFGVPVTRGSVAATAPVGAALFGRERELAALDTAWSTALAGQSQLLFVTGDAGIGKSALLAAFQQQHALQYPQSPWARGQCMEYTGTSEPYMPVLEALGHLLRKADDDKPVELMRRLAPSWLLQLPDLLDAGEYERLKRQNAGVPKERMLREIAEALEQLSLPQGLLLVIEDLHWSDAATLDLIAFLAQRQARSRLLVLVSFRPVDAIVAAHPVRRLQLTLKARAQAKELALQTLGVDAVQRYLSARLDLARYGDELPLRVCEHSGGLPLFMVQIADYLQQHPEDADTRSAQLHEVIPEALKDLISLQLHDLAPEQLQLLEAASVLGVEFSAAAVAAAAACDAEPVEQLLEQLADPPRFIESRGLAIWPDGTTSGQFRFRHALYPQVLRRTLVDSRRARLHRRVAERAEAAYGPRGAEIAGELAVHFEQGGLRARALHYRQLTARKALDRVAFDAARQEAEHGMQLLDALGDGIERDHAELALCTLSAHALQNEHGYTSPLADALFERITVLVGTCTDPPLLKMGLYSLWVRRHFQCRLDEALHYAGRLHQLGLQLGIPELEASGNTFLAVSLHLCGRFGEAAEHIEQAHRFLNGLDAKQFGIVFDLRIAAHSGRAVLQWMHGHPDQALHTAREALSMAETSGNPYARCMSRVATLNCILVYRRDWAQLCIDAADSIRVGEHYGHRDSLNWARRQYALALAMTGQPERGLPLLWQTLDTLHAQGSLLGLPMDYTLGAECCIALGDVARARWALDKAWQIIHSHHTVAFASETQRMEGLLLLAQGTPHEAAAEVHLQQALQAASTRQAPLLQLRAAVSLAGLWQRQGRAAEALALLQPLYQPLTEGRDSEDWQRADALMAQLLAGAPPPGNTPRPRPSTRR